MPSLLDQNRPVPSLFGANILGAEWVPSLRGAEFAKCEFAGAEFARCRSVRYPFQHIMADFGCGFCETK